MWLQANDFGAWILESRLSQDMTCAQTVAADQLGQEGLNVQLRAGQI